MVARLIALLLSLVWGVLGVALLLASTTIITILIVPCLVGSAECQLVRETVLYQGFFGRVPESVLWPSADLLGIALLWLSSVALFAFYANARAVVVHDRPGFDIISLSAGLLFLGLLMTATSSLNLLAPTWFDNVSAYYTDVIDTLGTGATLEQATYTRYLEQVDRYEALLQPINLGAAALFGLFGLLIVFQAIIYVRPARQNYHTSSAPVLSSDWQKYIQDFNDEPIAALHHTYLEATAKLIGKETLTYPDDHTRLQIELRPTQETLPAKAPRIRVQLGTVFKIGRTELPQGWEAPREYAQRGTYEMVGPAYLSEPQTLKLKLTLTDDVEKQPRPLTPHTISVSVSTDANDHTMPLPALTQVVGRAPRPLEKAIGQVGQVFSGQAQGHPERGEA